MDKLIDVRLCHRQSGSAFKLYSFTNNTAGGSGSTQAGRISNTRLDIFSRGEDVTKTN
jgi:hypothetical protein